MVHFSWLALSLSVAGIVSASGAIYEDGTRMLKHRRVSRSSLHHRTPGLARRAGAKHTKSQTTTLAIISSISGWDFFSESDPTNGNVNYLTKSDAFSKKLAYVQDNGTVIMKVDDTTWVSSGGNRNSVRIASSKSYTQGLFVLDVERCLMVVVFGPLGGPLGPRGPTVEKLIFSRAFIIIKSNDSSYVLGMHPRHWPPEAQDIDILSKNCDAAVNSNAGCAFLDSDKASYGSGLNAAGGGAYAMLWDDEGISIWFFPRSKMPSDIQNLKSKTNATADPSTWGTPKAHWTSSSCSTTNFFNSHSIVFDTTLCGDWAGATYSSAGCPGTCADRLKDPANFKDAVWKINSNSFDRSIPAGLVRETISGPDIRAQTNVDPIGPDSDSFNFPSVSYHVRIYQPNCIVAHKAIRPPLGRFLPFHPKLLALASSANYGLVGNGRLHVVSQGHPPAPTGAGGFDASTLRIDRAYRTQDGLYDLAWSELHENQIVTASGDGSLRLWDITMTDLPIRIKQLGRDCESVDTYERSIHPNYSGPFFLCLPGLFSPHTPDILATASTDGTMRLFDLRVPLHSLQPAANPNAPTLPLSSTPLARPSLTIPAHGTEILSLDWNKYRPWVLASSSVDKSVKIWDARQIQSNPTGEQGLVGGTCEIDLLGHEYAL
ncbi:peroxisomal targeting signal 2 receptor [Rhizoctonia solani]|uniref:Peroxin-7 n=1 Tax=Rhizoctonia solani TaxID=456999 RepID=A0A8H8ST59_9AGAM|nr:peroxisomal targeting signal 2 receptor [Rhizoctonia solani]QRW16739.1 peroxisomal targeting signal 2 receptor [Rhizoctonia solani]